MPLPDAQVPSGLSLDVSPAQLVIRPGSAARVRFTLGDGNGSAVPDYPVSFAIVDETGEITGHATLSSVGALTEGDGAAAVEIVVGNLADQSLPVSFGVKASAPGASDAQVDVMVTTNAFSVEVVPVAAEDLLGAATVKTTRLLFFDNATCADLDLVNPSAATSKPRLAHTVAVDSSWKFSGVAGTGSCAVVGQGLGSNTFVQIAGCVDIAGSSLSESQTMRAILYMDRLFPEPRGAFQVASDLVIDPTPPQLATVQSAWANWSRCNLDPARLWLDCTLDALTTTGADPLDCIPVETSEGALGDLLVARRGTVVAPATAATGTPSTSTDTPCRGPLDKTGSRSLETLVDGLFGSTRGQLQADDLGKFSNELTALLSELRLDSEMTIVETGTLNAYLVQHALTTLSFPNAKVPASVKLANLGLPSTSTQVVANLRAGLLSLPGHGFTLRLGSAVRAAFEATSLKSRGAQNTEGLIKAVFGLAQLKDGSATLTGCDALDAMVCDQLKQSRGCLTTACANGLTAMASRLVAPFSGLDGDGLDFYLSGAAPVVDLGGDGLADALGLGARAGLVSSETGLWSVSFRAGSGNFGADGAWTATRSSGSP